jgi:DNA gyrase subunit B
MSENHTVVPETPVDPNANGVSVTAADVAHGNEKYEGGDVQVLRDHAHIRQNPGMYIGDTGTKGLHHLVYELVANSVDEALAGFCKNIHVRIHLDGSLSVSDDGRGIPVDEHPVEKKSTLELVMTTVGAGGKFAKGAYKVSAGLHGMGAKAVTALSEYVEAQVQRSGRTYMQEYERGVAVTEVKDIGPAKRTGTRVKFKPDPEIFHDRTFDYLTLEDRLRELAFLNRGLSITLHDERTNKEDHFKYDGGLAEFVKHINRMDDVLHPPIHIVRSVDQVGDDGQVTGQVAVEVALQYTKTEEERVRCYTNNAFNSIGGTHLSGFRTALTLALKKYGERENLFKNTSPVGEDFREGSTVIISVLLARPQFDSQEKKRLNNLDVEGLVASVVGEALAKYLEEHPKEAKTIVNKVALAAEAREAASKAKKALKDRKSILNGGGLPGKLFDCNQRDRDSAELFLVEGDSAGGSAVEGREPMFQAILPLRGKPLNVEKARLDNLLKNEEICSLISAIGIDIGNNEDLSRLRYSKIIILSDADVDGQHIRTLLLTFFFRQMGQLVARGNIYIARPPLYKVTQKKNVRYVATVDEMQTELLDRGLGGTRLLVLPPPGAAAQSHVFEGAELAALVKLMARLEDALVILERMGLNLAALLPKVDERGLPTYRVQFASHVEWCFTTEEVDAFRQKQEKILGHELVLGSEAEAVEETNGQGYVYEVSEEQKVREVNNALKELRKLGLTPAHLAPAPRIAGREPPPRLVLETGEHRHPLEHLRELPHEVRRLGERGLSVTRFKGLGEMDPKELWETTLDPKHRTLVQVKLEDALKADEMFRTLMGVDAEERRNFINRYALDVKDIDYHGA